MEESREGGCEAGGGSEARAAGGPELETTKADHGGSSKEAAMRTPVNSISEVLRIHGGRQLHGEVEASGAKNSVLAIMAATLLNRGVNTIGNVPDPVSYTHLTLPTILRV